MKIPSPPSRVLTRVYTTTFNRPVDDVFSFCVDIKNFQKVFPERVEFLGEGSDSKVKFQHTYRFKHWVKRIIPIIWEIYIAEYEENKRYVDMQLKGFFRYFKHTHECRQEGNTTFYTDKIEFRSYFPEWMDNSIITWELNRLFKIRLENMKRLLES